MSEEVFIQHIRAAQEALREAGKAAKADGLRYTPRDVAHYVKQVGDLEYAYKADKEHGL